MKSLNLRVNGEPVHLLVEEDETLLDVQCHTGGSSLSPENVLAAITEQSKRKG